MDTVFEVLNGSTITTFPTSGSARLYMESVKMEGKTASMIMVATRWHEGRLLILEELIEVRQSLFTPEEA